MAKAYRTYLPEQDLLLPPSLRDWLPENHLAHFVSDVVDQLDLSAIESGYEKEERGQPPYHPRMMSKILLYGYCVGVFSSRRIEKKLVEDVGFRMLAAGNEPDFRTISDFRKQHLGALQGLFDQMLQIALQTGTMKLGTRRNAERIQFGDLALMLSRRVRTGRNQMSQPINLIASPNFTKANRQRKADGLALLGWLLIFVGGKMAAGASPLARELADREKAILVVQDDFCIPCFS
jgi:transposase